MKFFDCDFRLDFYNSLLGTVIQPGKFSLIFAMGPIRSFYMAGSKGAKFYKYLQLIMAILTKTSTIEPTAHGSKPVCFIDVNSGIALMYKGQPRTTSSSLYTII